MENSSNFFIKIYRKNPLSTYIILIVFTISFAGWNFEPEWSGAEEYIYVCLAMLSCMIIYPLTAYLNFFICRRVTKQSEFPIDFQVSKFAILFAEKIWNNRDFKIIFIPMQICNIIISIIYPEHFKYWAYLLLISLVLLQLSKIFINDSYIITILLGSCIISVIVFILINYQSLGIYYFDYFLHKIPLFNYNLDSQDLQDSFYEDPYFNQANLLESFNNRQMWEKFGNITPSRSFYFTFQLYGPKETFIFYSYPIVVFLLVFNSLSLLVNTIRNNITDRT